MLNFILRQFKKLICDKKGEPITKRAFITSFLASSIFSAFIIWNVGNPWIFRSIGISLWILYVLLMFLYAKKQVKIKQAIYKMKYGE